MLDCVGGEMGSCPLFQQPLCPESAAGRSGGSCSSPIALELDRERAASKNQGAPLIFSSRSDQPFTIPSPLRKPSHVRQGQKGEGGTC